MDDLGATNITQRGLLTLCRLNLTVLNICKAIGNIEYDKYGDEEASVVARHLPNLESLRADNNKLGWEGAAVIASSLTKLGSLYICNNETIGKATLARLSLLKELYARTCDSMQIIPE